MSRTPRTTPAPKDRPLLQQAPVVPLDASGLTAACVGAVLFGLATAVGHLAGLPSHWVWILGVGTVIGVLLIPFTALHRFRAHRQASRSVRSPNA